MAVPAAGTFTASQLLRIQAMASDLWADNQTRADYIAEADVLNAIRSEQTARLSALQDPEKTRTVRLMWLDACEVAVDDVDDDCDLTGTEASSDSKDYTLDLFKRTVISVKEIENRTDEFNTQQKAARLMLAADKALTEWLATQLMAKIETFRGTNTYTTPVGSTAWTFAASDTTIPADQWNTELFPKLSLCARKNKILNPFLISGEALWYTNENAYNNVGNDDGKGDNVRNQKYFSRRYFDPVRIDEANSGTLKAYMISRGALAVVTKTHYPTAPVVYHNPWHSRYRMASKNMPGIDYEVTYTQACASNEITHTWQLKLNAGIFLNPTGCTESRTGVLSFVRETGL